MQGVNEQARTNEQGGNDQKAENEGKKADALDYAGGREGRGVDPFLHLDRRREAFTNRGAEDRAGFVFAGEAVGLLMLFAGGSQGTGVVAKVTHRGVIEGCGGVVPTAQMGTGVGNHFEGLYSKLRGVSFFTQPRWAGGVLTNVLNNF